MGSKDTAVKANKARLLYNYYLLGGRDIELFEALVKPLLKLASASEPCPMPDLPVMRQPIRKKLLIESLSKLAG